MAKTIADCNAEATSNIGTFNYRNIGQQHDNLVARIQSTFATGDYEDLFFMVLLEMKFSPDDLDMVAVCYEQVMEDNYYGD